MPFGVPGFGCDIQIEQFDSVMHYRVGIKVVAGPNASQTEVWIAYEKYVPV
ncbi:hypothetical protein [Microbulbifer sp. ANSA005]|uniref:hypothetical protein n=1 Tax=Microbulbifer sp. ANSA005 TaxID=3243362 RepID=UPI004042F75D